MQPSKSGPLWSGLQTTHFFTLSSPVLLSQPSWLGSKYFLCPLFFGTSFRYHLRVVVVIRLVQLSAPIISLCNILDLSSNVKIQNTPLSITSLHKDGTWNISVFQRRFLVHLAEVFDGSQISVTDIEVYSPSHQILYSCLQVKSSVPYFLSHFKWHLATHFQKITMIPRGLGFREEWTKTS